jgi:hypothetical protein
MEKQKLRISVNRMIEGELGTHVDGWAFMSMPMCEAPRTKIGIWLVGRLVELAPEDPGQGERRLASWILTPNVGHPITSENDEA